MKDKELAEKTKEAFHELNLLLHDCHVYNISVDFEITEKIHAKQNCKLKLNSIKKDLLL